MQLTRILDARCILLDLAGSSKKEVLARLATPITELRPQIDHENLVRVLMKREEASSTAIADGIAIPHGKVPLGEEVVAAFGRSRAGIDFDSIDGRPTKLFFLLVSPESHPSLHLRWLAHIASLLKSASFREALLAADSPEQVLAILVAEEERARTTQP